VGARLASDRPDLVIPIDYPGFNLRLAQAARRRGIRVLYYIAPQVWAWHRSRLRKLAACTDRLAVILPFEATLFEDAGARAEFVGHPLLDVEPVRRPRATFCADNGLEPDRPILALFPGSRRQEVARHLELFEHAAARVVDARPAVQPVIARGEAVPPAAYADGAWPHTAAGWELLQHADAALVKSGTTTLQAALAGTPMVIAYRMHPASYALARRLVRVEHIGLANLVAGGRVAPELVQDEATPDALARAVLPLLDRASDDRRRMVDRLADVRRRLRRREPGSAADRVASLAAELLERP